MSIKPSHKNVSRKSERESWSTVLFLHNGYRLRRIKQTRGTDFHVGIWWHNAHTLVAFLQSIIAIKAPSVLIDSEFSHDACWNSARKELTCPDGTEYFDIPRGRIVWDTLHATGLLYHGNATPSEVLEELARLYGLPRWEARLDEHYLTGNALEEFYGFE